VVLVVQTLVGVAKTYWVSFLGTAALAGVTLVFPISMLMTMMSNGGIGGGVASARGACCRSGAAAGRRCTVSARSDPGDRLRLADALAGYGIASRLDYVLIPIRFGFGTGVGTNMVAGDLGRAKRIAWTGAFLGFLVAEITGVVVAIAPTLWLHLFSHDQGVIAIGSLYLRIVAPVYGSVGAAMLLYFAPQGGGRMLWPFLGGQHAWSSERVSVGRLHVGVSA
jgi:Na+-driven multidrug efflux pump